PALESLIKDAKKRKFDTVLVYKLDRLSRSQKDTLHLIEDVFIKNGIEFLSLQENFDTSTPFGKAMIGLLSVFAQLEREQ
ncbi:recombinase family protein, partial [Streptococcus pneumoniae]|nr:recombinase family protein [Streptococcus pneumoniae]